VRASGIDDIRRNMNNTAGAALAEKIAFNEKSSISNQPTLVKEDSDDSFFQNTPNTTKPDLSMPTSIHNLEDTQIIKGSGGP